MLDGCGLPYREPGCGRGRAGPSSTGSRRARQRFFIREMASKAGDMPMGIKLGMALCGHDFDVYSRGNKAPKPARSGRLLRFPPWWKSSDSMISTAVEKLGNRLYRASISRSVHHSMIRACAAVVIASPSSLSFPAISVVTRALSRLIEASWPRRAQAETMLRLLRRLVTV